MLRIDPDAQVGDQVTIDGIIYIVMCAHDLGPLTQMETEYRRMLGLQRPRGTRFYALSVTADGRYGRLVDVCY